MANETVTVTQTLDQVTVTSSGATGLVGGGTIEGDLNVGVDGTGHDVKFFGDTAGKYMQWDQSADKLFINGEFEVNGTATTFNSTVITIDDPIFSLGGQQRTDALDDSKDRGIEFFYHDGAQKTGFMGYDDSADAFTFLTSATNSNEIFSGTAGNLLTGNITADSSGSSGQFTAKRNGSALLTTMLANNDGGFQYTGSGGNIFYAGANGNDYVIRDGNFSTDGDLRFIINSSGNVGIGTTSPLTQLHVNNSVSGSNTNGISIGKIEGSGWTDTNEELGRLSWYGTYSNSYTAGVGAYISAAADANWDGTETPSRLTFSTTPESSTTPAERLRIDKDGKVGIGTASPAHLLHVYSSGNGEIEVERASGAAILTQAQASLGRFGTSSNHNLQLMANNSGYVTVTTAGNVGVGTTAPSFTSGGGLQITHSSQANVRLSDSSDVSYNTDVAMSNADFYLVNRSSTGDLKFRVNGSTEAITVIPSGNVGIGTTSPAVALDVDGDIRVLDGHKLLAGDSSDFEIKHTGDTYLSNLSGAMYFRQQVTDGDMVFQSDDGSGGDETYFFLDGSTGYTQFPDNKRLVLGSGNDLQIYHDALDSKIENSTGHIYVTNFTDDKDIIFQTDNGSGGVTPYIATLLFGSTNLPSLLIM